MIAFTPDWLALRIRISHTHWTWLTQVLLADGTVLDLRIPSPDCNRVPFLQLEDFLLGVHFNLLESIRQAILWNHFHIEI
jgi:hypothetical protein